MENEIKPKLTDRMKSQFLKYLRVWRLLKKPSMKEFTTIAKVSAIGILLIGAIGFIISVAIHLL